jgi:hypothetical protein
LVGLDHQEVKNWLDDQIFDLISLQAEAHELPLDWPAEYADEIIDIDDFMEKGRWVRS